MVWIGPGMVDVPKAYRLNCLAPPQLAVPVEAAPMDPLQMSVQACEPVRLVTAEPAQLKTEPP